MNRLFNVLCTLLLAVCLSVGGCDDEDGDGGCSDACDKLIQCEVEITKGFCLSQCKADPDRETTVSCIGFSACDEVEECLEE